MPPTTISVTTTISDRAPEHANERPPSLELAPVDSALYPRLALAFDHPERVARRALAETRKQARLPRFTANAIAAMDAVNDLAIAEDDARLVRDAIAVLRPDLDAEPHPHVRTAEPHPHVGTAEPHPHAVAVAERLRAEQLDRMLKSIQRRIVARRRRRAELSRGDRARSAHEALEARQVAACGARERAPGTTTTTHLLEGGDADADEPPPRLPQGPPVRNTRWRLHRALAALAVRGSCQLGRVRRSQRRPIRTRELSRSMRTGLPGGVQ